MGKRKRDSIQAKGDKRGKYEDISKAFGSKLTVQKTKKRPFVESWFDELMNGDTGKIEPEGVEILCNQLGLAPDSLEILIMSYLMNIQQMGYIDRTEFSKMAHHIKSKSTLKNHLVEQRMGLKFEMDMAKKLHRFAFDFCREKEKKIIDKETAVAMLTCIMQNRWKLVNTFIDYLIKSTYRGINRDQWNNVFEFVRTFGDFENVQDYDPDGAWPVMIDEFVEFVKASRNSMDC